MDLPEALQQAVQHLRSGAPARCRSLCDAILARNPGLIQALYLRGCAAYETGDIASSISDLGIVHDNHPELPEAAYYLGRSLRAMGRFEEAIVPLEAARDDSELAVRARYELAQCLLRLRRRREAADQYRAILELEPDNAQVAANLAAVLERENRLDEAQDWTTRALATDPANETARMTRAVLDRRGGDYVQAAAGLRKLIPGITDPGNKSIAWNQLGQCLEGMADWDNAFDAFTESNRILTTHLADSRPDPRSPTGLTTLARIQQWLQEKPIAAWQAPATSDPGGIAFLVGFPRSGTTLLDRMLSGHPDIEVLEEKSLFSCLHQDWSQPGTLEALAEVNEAQIIDARNIYRREMSRHRRHPRRSLVIDKLPLNLAYLFLIHRLFPEAPVIFLLRHPLDACISCYFQAFELEGSMAYFLDLGQTANYYDAVMQVAMSSVDQIGNPVHRLRYEDLVVEPQAKLEAVVEFLELDWNDSVLQYRPSTDDATSNTPSYQQVVEPLHTRSIGRWKHYANRLGSRLAVLEPWVTRFGYRQTNTA